MRSVLCLLLAINSVFGAEIDTGPLEAWLKHQSGIKNLQTDFIQERKLPALKKPVSTPGTMTMVMGGSMRWDLGKPPKTTAISDGKTMRFIDIEKKRARTMSADSPQAKSFTLLGSSALDSGLEGFTQSFDLIETRITHGIYQLTTRPRDRAMRKRVSWVFFDIDPAKKELRAMEIQLEDKSRIRTVFQNPRFNIEIPKNHFEFDLTGYKVR